MKILDRYIIKSILVTAFLTILVFAFILAGVELFTKMDSLMNGKVPIPMVIKYLVLSIPSYLMMGASLALLFSTTYFLAMLSANNERIAILNAGLSTNRLARPIIILSIFLTILGIGFQQYLLNPLVAMHDEVAIEIFGSSSTQDSRNIVLKDTNGYLVYTQRFNENTMTIYNPVIIRSDKDDMLLRIEARTGVYEEGKWNIYNATVYQNEQGTISSHFEDYLCLEDMQIEPEYFKASNINVDTMDFKTAHQYLKKLKSMDIENWQVKCTDYLRSLFSPMAIFVLMTVSATLSYRFKKNVLLFSIIQALSIAIVYYVADMVFSIAAHQGAISPYMCVALPVIISVGISIVFNYLGKYL